MYLLFSRLPVLASLQPWNSKDWIPLRTYRVFLHNKDLGILAVALFLLGFAIGSINVLQGFVVEIYDYSNTQSVLLFLYALVMLALSSFSSHWVISKIGAHAALKSGIALVLGGFVILVFSQSTIALVYIGILVMASGAFATPAFLTIISKIVPASEQGELQGAVNSVTLLSSGIGSIVYSAIFGAVRHNKIGASLPFLVGAVCVAAALAITFYALTFVRSVIDVTSLPTTIDDSAVIRPSELEMTGISGGRDGEQSGAVMGDSGAGDDDSTMPNRRTSQAAMLPDGDTDAKAAHAL